jgi:branched-chain amino acid transport system ATP-binding protein
MGEVILQTKGLTKLFGKFMAIDDIDIEFKSGIITSIIGPNGAGKTTTINLLTGALRPDKGKVYFKDHDITALAPHERVKQGITRSFQIMNIFPMLTVLQNTQLPLFPLLGKQLKWFKAVFQHEDVMEEAEKILRGLNLWDKRERIVGELSHGDQRALEMGMAIAAKPEICFLDEPSSGMNPLERASILKLIKKLAEEANTTFVIVEHDMDVIFSLSDWIIVMDKGKVLAEGQPDEIRQNKNVVNVYLGEEN